MATPTRPDHQPLPRTTDAEETRKRVLFLLGETPLSEAADKDLRRILAMIDVRSYQIAHESGAQIVTAATYNTALEGVVSMRAIWAGDGILSQHEDDLLKRLGANLPKLPLIVHVSTLLTPAEAYALQREAQESGMQDVTAVAQSLFQKALDGLRLSFGIPANWQED